MANSHEGLLSRRRLFSGGAVEALFRLAGSASTSDQPAPGKDQTRTGAAAAIEPSIPVAVGMAVRTTAPETLPDGATVSLIVFDDPLYRPLPTVSDERNPVTALRNHNKAQERTIEALRSDNEQLHGASAVQASSIADLREETTSLSRKVTTQTGTIADLKQQVRALQWEAFKNTPLLRRATRRHVVTGLIATGFVTAAGLGVFSDLLGRGNKGNSSQAEVKSNTLRYKNGNTIAFHNRADLPKTTVVDSTGRIKLKEAFAYQKRYPERTLIYQLSDNAGHIIGEVSFQDLSELTEGDHGGYAIAGDQIILRGVADGDLSYGFVEKVKQKPLDAGQVFIQTVDQDAADPQLKMEAVLDLPVQKRIKDMVAMAESAKLQPVVYTQKYGEESRLLYQDTDTGEIGIVVSEALFTKPEFIDTERKTDAGEQHLYYRIMQGIAAQMRLKSDGTNPYPKEHYDTTSLDTIFNAKTLSAQHTEILDRVSNNSYAYKDEYVVPATKHPIFELIDLTAYNPVFFPEGTLSHPSVSVQASFASVLTVERFYADWIQGRISLLQSIEPAMNKYGWADYGITASGDASKFFLQANDVLQAIAQSGDTNTLNAFLPSDVQDTLIEARLLSIGYP